MIGGCWHWKPGMEFNRTNLLSQFGRQLMSDGHIYLSQTPKSETRAVTDARAEFLHLPRRDADGNRWAYRHLLSRGQRFRLQNWEKEAKAKGYGPNDPIFFDLSQHCHFSNISVAMSALLQKSEQWSHKFKRMVATYVIRHIWRAFVTVCALRCASCVCVLHLLDRTCC